MSIWPWTDSASAWVEDSQQAGRPVDLERAERIQPLSMRPCRLDLMTSGCPGPPQPLGHGPLESLPAFNVQPDWTPTPRATPAPSCQPLAARRQSPSQAASRPQVASTVNHASHIALDFTHSLPFGRGLHRRLASSLSCSTSHIAASPNTDRPLGPAV